MDLTQWEKYDPVRLAALCVQLPVKSRVYKAIDPRFEWDIDTAILARIEHLTNLIWWSKTKDGQKDRNRPEPIEPPKTKEEKEQERKRDRRGISIDKDEFMRRFGYTKED